MLAKLNMLSPPRSQLPLSEAPAEAFEYSRQLAQHTASQPEFETHLDSTPILRLTSRFEMLEAKRER